MPATAFTDIAPGIQLACMYGGTGIWFLRYGIECAIVELPGIARRDPANRPWDTIGEHIDKEGLHPKFITATHDHWDHFSIYSQFNKRLPKVPIIVHRSFFPIERLARFITPEGIAKGAPGPASVIHGGTPIHCFEGQSFATDLTGEPLYLIHAPKHCPTDTMVIFRGSMITGDWWLGPGDPNPNKVPIPTIHASISFLEEFCRKKNYVIHNLFSVHANEFRRDVTFEELMESTRP